MPGFKSDFLRVLQERGFIHQISDPAGLDALCARSTVSAYVGYDCTAPSLHAGNLVSVMMFRWFQETGHRPIVLMGDGTTRIGDPSGRDETRQLLSEESINANKERIKTVFGKILNFGTGPTDAVMAQNSDWLLSLNCIEFLRDFGRHFSVNQMLQRDSVRLRLEREQHLSFLEFNYMVFQAYDYLELYRRYGCRLQMGGSDQWGNIVSGVDLIRRVESEEAYALTTPLLTTSSGAKMGKTAAGALWLSEDMLAPYDYWQYWRNVEDGDVGRFLKLFTTLPLDEIARLDRLEGAERNDAKKVLATEATAIVHGRAAAEDAAETARRTFEEGDAGGALPTAEIPSAELEAGLGLLSAVVRTGLADSNGEVRRHVRSGAVRVNDVVASDERAQLTLADAGDTGTIKISLGRKKHALLRVI